MAPARSLSTLAPTARGIDGRAVGTRFNVVIANAFVDNDSNVPNDVADRPCRPGGHHLEQAA